MKLNNRGVNLLELMVVIGIVTGIAMVVMNLNKESVKSAAKYQYDNEVATIKAEIGRILSSTDSCMATIGAGVTATVGGSVTAINYQPAGGPPTPAAIERYRIPTPAPGIGNAQLQFSSPASLGASYLTVAVVGPPAIPAKEQADLTLLIERKKIFQNYPQTRVKITLDIVKNAAGLIIGCKTAGASSGSGTSKLIGKTSDNTSLTAMTFLGMGAGGITAVDGASTTTAGGNTGIGFNALLANTTGQYNTAVGDNARSAHHGSLSVAVGVGASQSDVNGGQVAMGYHAHFAAASANAHNSAYGYESLAANNNSQLEAFGFQSAAQNISGSQYSVFGYQALYKATDVFFAVAFGYQALYSSSSSSLQSRSLGVGYRALYSATSAINNTAVGDFALQSNVTGSNNTAIGKMALAANTRSDNTAVGFKALASNETGIENTAVGTEALSMNQIGSSNTAVGFEALKSSTGSRNTAIGSLSLAATSSGNDNTALGYSALKKNTGSGNTALGSEAMAEHTSGDNNVAAGFQALQNPGTGTGNIAVGYKALQNASGDYNMAIGKNAGAHLGGSNNIIIGNDDGSRMVGSGNILITTGEAFSASRTAISIDSAGAVDLIGASSVYAPNWMTTSDVRLKKDIKIIPNALSRLFLINGVSFNWDNTFDPEIYKGDKPQLGVIAQQVEKVFPAAVTKDKKGIRSVAYNMLIAPIIESIKELYHKYISRLLNSDQKHTQMIAALKTRHENLKMEKDKEIAALKARIERVSIKGMKQ